MRICALIFLLAGAFASPAGAARVQEVTSAGGITAWLIEDATIPAFSLRLAVRHAGSAYDPPNKAGRAVLVAGLLMEGAGEKDSRAFHDALDFHAIQLGIGADRDDLGVSMTSLVEHEETAFSLLGDALIRPRLSEEDFRRLQDEKRAELRQQESDADTQADKLFHATAFAGHPYAMPPDGDAMTLATLSREDMAAYVDAHLRRGEVMLSVAGDISPERLKKLIETYLDPLPEGKAKAGALPPAPAWKSGAREKRMDVPQSVVRFALPGIRREDPEYYAAYVVNYLFGGNALSSRLGKEIRETRGLAYYANTSLAEYDHASLVLGDFATRNGEVAQAVGALREEMVKARNHGFSESETREAVDYITGAFPAQIASNRSLAAYLDAMQRYRLGQDYLDRRNALMRAVTRKQVNALAKKLFKPENLLIITAGNPKNALKNTEKNP